MIRKVNAAVLFIQDLDTCMKFYRDTLGFKMTFNDDVSFAFELEGQDFVVLTIPAAVDMLGEEAISAGKEAVHRVMLCAEVASVDAVHQALTAKGVTFIKPPKDQAWGRRTAHFADPEGNLWEVYEHLEQK